MSTVTPPTARALLALLAPALGAMSACKPDGGLTKFNSPPEAQITAPAPDAAALAGTALTLRGAASDPNHDTDSLSTRWFVDGAEACAAAPPAADGTTTCEITVPNGTSVEIRLEVIDPEGAADTASQSLAITPNAAPTVTIAAPLADDVHYSDQLITFRGTVADAEDPADALTVWWEDGATRLDAVEATPNASGEVLGYAALAEGPHALELHARDSAGNESIATVLIDVGPPNTAPACAFTAPVDGGASEAGERVDLRATVSDPDVPADRLRVDWSSDKDGPLGNSTPDSAGLVAFSTGDLSVDTHRLTLTVQDEVGATCTTALTWTVGTPPSIVLEAPLDGEVVNEGEALTFTALVTDGEDVPGDLWVTWESDIDGVFAAGPPDSAGVAETVETSLTRGSHQLTATVTDTTGLFTQARLGFVVNGPPVISALTITPNPAANDGTLSCAASATDPDGGAPALAYAWTNTTRGTSLASGPSLTLTSALAAPGDTLTCAATATDGDGGSATASTTVTLSNRPPVATATLSPSSGVTRTSTLTCTGSATDADADSTSLSFAWTVNGAPVSASSSAASLSTLAGAFVAGQLVACTVTANDGKGGAATDTAQVTVGNTAPVVGTVSLSPTAPATNDTLTANTTTSDADGDALTVRYDWTVGSSVVQSGPSNSLIGAYFSRGDRVFVVVTANDGTTTTSATSPTVTVANTAPGAPGVEITPAAPEAGDSLVCAVTTPSADADGDALAYQFAWEVNGVAYTGATDDLMESIVDGSDVAGSERWTCIVRVSDGTDISIATAEATVAHPAPEGCDGIDNDADGLVDEEGDCPCPNQSYDGHGYMVCATTATYATNEAFCATYGYHAIKIESSAENTFIRSLSSDRMWIGLEETGGAFRWFDGTTPTFTSWDSAFSQPDPPTDEPCVAFWSGGWHDVVCTSTAYTIACEADG